MNWRVFFIIPYFWFFLLQTDVSTIDTPSTIIENSKQKIIFIDADTASTYELFAHLHILYALKSSFNPYIIIRLAPEFVSLIKRCSFIDHVISQQETAIPEHDLKLTLTDIAHEFACDNMIQQVPYITPEVKLSEYWHQQLTYKNMLRIGISMQNIPTEDSSYLSALVQLFEQLSTIPNIGLFCLHIPEDNYLVSLPDKTCVINLHNRNPYETYTAIIKHLDLIITGNTAIAHLASTLGKPVWVLIPDKDHQKFDHYTTWYPTMRTFYNNNKWENSIHEIVKEVKKMSTHTKGER